jgi:hypothetical protein
MGIDFTYTSVALALYSCIEEGFPPLRYPIPFTVA